MRKLLTITAGAAAAFLLTTPALAQDDSEAGQGSQDQTADDNAIDDGDSNTQLEDSIQNMLNGWSNMGNDSSSDQDNDGNGSFNNNRLVVAQQELKAVNINKYLDEVVDLDGVDEDPSSVGYNSGNNVVRDNAFAAFAGIANAAWNTGINANTQAATNIAAQGTINFGVTGNGGGGGGGDGDGD